VEGKEAAMTLFQTAFIIPVVALGAAFDSHQVTASAARFGERSMAMPKYKDDSQAQTQMSFVLRRKERIQNVLIQLDRIAQVTAQMKPETSDRVEPVLSDLAEQTIELATEDGLQSPETDAALERIEATVSQLTKAVNRYVEPEASL
jgi:hypothetical protein